MVKTPGPQQRFNSNIVKISFTGGGLIYLRASAQSNSASPSAPGALVKGLPWDNFDLYDVREGVDDPKAPSDVKKKTAAITDPVTDDMIAKYLYWAHYKVVHESFEATTAPIDKYVVDTANWTATYGGRRGPFFSPVETKDQALEQFRRTASEIGLDPSLIGADLLTNTGAPIEVPSDLFFIGVTEAGWTYHIERTPGQTVFSQNHVASVILNIGKISRDTPLENKKRPPFIDFTITGPDRDNGVSASAWVTSKPPKEGTPDPLKDKRRRTFPLREKGPADKVTLNEPDFPHPDDGAEGFGTYRLTFGTAATPPKIELKSSSGQGGPS